MLYDITFIRTFENEKKYQGQTITKFKMVKSSQLKKFIDVLATQCEYCGDKIILEIAEEE
jgi:hypothetical protein